MASRNPHDVLDIPGSPSGFSGATTEILMPRTASTGDSGLLLRTSATGREQTQTVEVFHEWSPIPSDSTVERVLDLDPQRPLSQIRFRSHLLADAGKRLSSPDYLASVRRRRSAKIAGLVQGLSIHSESPNFPIWTHEVLEGLRSLVQFLSDAEQFSDSQHEGNSCEILRQVRDTLLNLGWENYRRVEARNCVAAILRHLAQTDEVSPADADLAMDQLLDLGLDPAVGLQVSYEHEDREARLSG